MTTTDATTQVISATVTGNKLDLSNAEYIKSVATTSEFNSERYNASSTAFPDTDNEDRVCRVTCVDPQTGALLGGCSSYPGHDNFKWVCPRVATVVYPDGQAIKLPKREAYEAHKGKSMSHFAMAALSAWKPGDARTLGGNYGAESTSNKFSNVMWERALVQGYIAYSASADGRSHGYYWDPMVRTDKPVVLKPKRTRRMGKNAVWPFTEKDHWLKIMNGSLQICHTNTTMVLKDSQNGLSSNDREILNRNFPVFESASEFKRARKFFEGLSAIKNEGANQRKTPDWDPLRRQYNDMSSGIQRYTTRQSFTSLLASPFSIIKTSMMLSCVPQVDEDGVVRKFKEVTAEYLNSMKTVTPVLKAVAGTWVGKYGYLRNGYPNNTDMTEIKDLLNVDNMTHMYMILLNELRLLDNESFDRWCKGNNLIYGPFDFDKVLASEEKRTVYGYKLTETLNYSCLVWGKDHKEN